VMMGIMSCMSHVVRHIVCHELSFDTDLFLNACGLKSWR
jgi:hypothetical protein